MNGGTRIPPNDGYQVGTSAVTGDAAPFVDRFSSERRYA